MKRMFNIQNRLSGEVTMSGKHVLALLALTAAMPAAAQNFSCSNKAAEIRCGGGSCEAVTEGFTPMSVSRTGANLSVCAYSGCWEGPLLVRRAAGPVDLLYARVRQSSGTGGTAAGMRDLSILYDRGARTAQMRWGGFANAMGCGSND
jgi:hypothetical protein